jgi:hypothetical protein
MDCPQCGAKVPSDDLFCGKCGYAMRDDGPGRVDQSRIRVHEGPDPAAPRSPSGTSTQQRIRKHTMMGMPSATPPAGTRTPPVAATPPSPPTEISTARSRAQKRTPQKTMLGIPRPDFPERPPASASDPPPERQASAWSAEASDALPQDTSSPSHRARARVRYDSADEPYPVVQHRKKALRALALLLVLAGAWLAYRYLSLNG